MQSHQNTPQAAQQHGAKQESPRRSRRRAVLKNPEEYDRTPESGTYVESSEDALREVVIDADAAEQLTGREFYEQERPPHYGE